MMMLVAVFFFAFLLDSGLARMNTFRASISFNGECQKFISNQTSTYPLWIQCFINCGKDNECQIAYISIDNTICFLCQTGVVKSLTRTKTGNIVALKNDDNEPPQCINGVYNLPVTTTVSSITTSTKRSCPPNYQLFFFGMMGLGALEWNSNRLRPHYKNHRNSVMQYYVSSRIFKSVLNPLFNNNLTLWIDGMRKEECYQLTSFSNPECNQLKAYTFADESLQSINAYKLLNTQADITALDCLQMLINSDATNGLVLNSRCDSITGYATYSRGAVCGVKPQ